MHLPALLTKKKKKRAKIFFYFDTNKYYLEIIILNVFPRSRYTLLCDMFQIYRHENRVISSYYLEKIVAQYTLSGYLERIYKVIF